jgi:hypothetical protein
VDPDGRIPLPLIAAGLYGAFEIGSSLYDVYSMAEVSVDPNATNTDRGLIASGFAPYSLSSENTGNWMRRNVLKY